MSSAPFRSARAATTLNSSPSRRRRPLRHLGATAIAALMAVWPLAPTISVALGQARPSPVGQWELTNGEQRYRVSYCGNGEQLCAKLVWLHPSLRTPENVQLLNSYVVRGAVPTEDGGWQGTVTFEGKDYSGKVTLVGEGAMRVNACSGMLCQTFNLRSI